MTFYYIISFVATGFQDRTARTGQLDRIAGTGQLERTLWAVIMAGKPLP
jgi:hypothetical protein